MVSSANVEKQPNFLWLNTHDLSARHLGCYGDSYAKTPNLDKLSTIKTSLSIKAGILPMI